MRLLKEQLTLNSKMMYLDLEVTAHNGIEILKKTEAFQPEVIFALSTDENEYVLDLGIRYHCHMGFFKPFRKQLDLEKLAQSREKQLAKIIFLAKDHPELAHFSSYGQVIHQHYIQKCEKLLNFLFFCDADAFD